MLHTVGPVIFGAVTAEDEALLSSCYRSCLSLAAESGCKSVALCCISTGVFRFPPDLAARIAVQTVSGFLKKDTSIRRVIFNAFKDSDMEIYHRLLS